MAIADRMYTQVAIALIFFSSSYAIVSLVPMGINQYYVELFSANCLLLSAHFDSLILIISLRMTEKSACKKIISASRSWWLTLCLIIYLLFASLVVLFLQKYTL